MKDEAAGIETKYVIDGEFYGGPTRFINHSCEPNCRQFSVFFNKGNPYIYEIAFFATRDIPKGTELTFDYFDEDSHEPNEFDPELMRCLCGAKNCRGTLW